MEQKQLWTVTIVAVFVAVIASVITANIVSSNIALGPSSISRDINAHECRADGFCEMDNANIDQYLTVGNVEIQPAGDIILERVISLDNPLTRIGFDGNRIELDGEVRVVGNPAVFGNSATGQVIILDGEITMDELDDPDPYDNNTVSGYACFDPNGKLFRSQIPCV